MQDDEPNFTLFEEALPVVINVIASSLAPALERKIKKSAPLLYSNIGDRFHAPMTRSMRGGEETSETALFTVTEKKREHVEVTLTDFSTTWSHPTSVSDMKPIFEAFRIPSQQPDQYILRVPPKSAPFFTSPTDEKTPYSVPKPERFDESGETDESDESDEEGSDEEEATPPLFDWNLPTEFALAKFVWLSWLYTAGFHPILYEAADFFSVSGLDDAYLTFGQPATGDRCKFLLEKPCFVYIDGERSEYDSDLVLDKEYPFTVYGPTRIEDISAVAFLALRWVRTCHFDLPQYVEEEKGSILVIPIEFIHYVRPEKDAIGTGRLWDVKACDNHYSCSFHLQCCKTDGFGPREYLTADESIGKNKEEYLCFHCVEGRDSSFIDEHNPCWCMKCDKYVTCEHYCRNGLITYSHEESESEE